MVDPQRRRGKRCACPLYECLFEFLAPFRSTLLRSFGGRNMDLSEADLLEPNPDIHVLFHHYNLLYFHDAIRPCSVSWSSFRMSRRTSVCRYLTKGGCEIRLSEPLLKFHPTADLKNTLLHEMIHAFLYIKEHNKNHSDHGPSFLGLMNAINFSSLDDHQRPVGGYNITIYHDFHGEVDNYSVHHWTCESCGDLIKRAINTEPSASDCLERVKHDGSCGSPLCHWHSHKMSCSGSYKKIAETPEYEGKRKHSKGKQGLQKDKRKESTSVTGQEAVKEHNGVEIKEEPEIRKSKRLTNFYSAARAENLNSGNSSAGDYSQTNLKSEEFEATDLKTHSLAMPKQIPRAERSAPSKKRKRVGGGVNLDKSETCKCPYTVMSEWLDLYADEEFEHEDLEPLINKRTERRKKQKLLKNNKIIRVTNDESMAGDSPFHPGCSNGSEEDKFAIECASMDPENIIKSKSINSMEELDRSAASMGKASDVCRDMISQGCPSEYEAFPADSPGRENVLDISDG